MKVPLLDLKAQYATIKEEVDSVVSRVIESQYFILSEEVDALEREVAVYSGIPYAAGLASGTDALILALRALGISKGDYVITTPFTFFATTEAVSLLGATPLFADIEEDSYNIDPVKIEEQIKKVSPSVRTKIKAIIPVHLYGQCADMDKVLAVAKKRGLKIAEDCAQAIGAVYKGKKAGSFGDIGCLSFFPSKNLGGFGDGGMVVSNSHGIIDHVKRLRVHGSDKQYIHSEIGYNSRLDSLQAAILRVKLKRLDLWLEGRRKIAAVYNEELSKIEGVKTPKTMKDNVHTYHQYTICVEKRDELMSFLNNEKGIGSRVYYPVPMHLQPCYKELNHREGEYPVAEKAAKEALSLPVYPELSAEQVQYVIDSVKEFMQKG